MRLAILGRFFALAVLVTFVSVAPARAAKSEKDDKGDNKPALYAKDGDKYRPATAEELQHAGHDEHKGGGLDFTGIKRYDLGIYTLIVFGILLLVLSKYAWPHIKSGLEKREANILSALDQARKDRTDAEASLTEAKKQLAEAAMHAKAILDEARKDAEALRAAEREAGVKDAQEARERAKREGEADRATLTKEVQQQAVELAVLIASKAIRQQVSIQSQNTLLDESIAELKTNATRA